MGIICVINGCQSKACKKDVGVNFFSFPNENNCYLDVYEKELASRRRKLWLERAQLVDKNITSASRVCSKHFVNGSPSLLRDDTHFDWAPSMKLHQDSSTSPSLSAVKRVGRNIVRSFKVFKTSSAISTSDSAASSTENPMTGLDHFDNSATEETECVADGNTSTNFNNSVEEDMSCSSTNELPFVTSLDAGLNTIHLEHSELLQQIEMLEQEIKRLKVEVLEAKKEDWFSKCQKSEERMKYYTRLTPKGFESLFESLLPISEHGNCALSLRKQFFLTLVKLAHNLDFDDLAYRFNISPRTASRYFFKWINIIDDRLFSKVVFWPELADVQLTMPMCFRDHFGNCITIIDCFEVQIQTPHNPMDQAATFSDYKQRNTVKYLIAITPNGTVCFISTGVPGRISDKQVVVDSGILDHLKPGVLVMADRGFKIEAEVTSRHAHLVTPAFMQRRSQLSEESAEETRRIANVRIHVERIIGSERIRFKILQGPVKIDFLNSYEESLTFYDKIVRVCSILLNLMPSVIPSD